MMSRTRSFLVGAGLLALAACSNGGDTDSQPAQAEAKPLPAARMTGTVAYRERMPLRPDYTITVRLEDVSRADAPAMVLAEQTLDTKGKAIPVPWALVYDPTRVDERMSYAVRAEIRDGQNRLQWTTTTHHPVLTRDAPRDEIEIMLERVAQD